MTVLVIVNSSQEALKSNEVGKAALELQVTALNQPSPTHFM